MLFPPRGRRRRRGEGDGEKGELNVFLSLCSCGLQSGAPPQKRRQARDAGILTDRHAREEEEGRRIRTRFFPLPHRRGKSSAGRACFPPRCLRSLALGPLRRRREAHRRAKNKSIGPHPPPLSPPFSASKTLTCHQLRQKQPAAGRRGAAHPPFSGRRERGALALFSLQKTDDDGEREGCEIGKKKKKAHRARSLGSLRRSLPVLDSGADGIGTVVGRENKGRDGDRWALSTPTGEREGMIQRASKKHRERGGAQGKQSRGACFFFAAQSMAWSMAASLRRSSLRLFALFSSQRTREIQWRGPFPHLHQARKMTHHARQRETGRYDWLKERNKIQNRRRAHSSGSVLSFFFFFNPHSFFSVLLLTASSSSSLLLPFSRSCSLALALFSASFSHFLPPS